MAEPWTWCVGIDWGVAEHERCVVDAKGQVHAKRSVAHHAEAVTAAIVWLRAVTGSPISAIAVAIERPRGVLVATVLDQGFAVCAMNPTPLDRFRDRFTASGAKDDARDAPVLADALRTDRRAFRRVQPDDPTTRPLRE